MEYIWQLITGDYPRIIREDRFALRESYSTTLPTKIDILLTSLALLDLRFEYKVQVVADLLAALVAQVSEEVEVVEESASCVEISTQDPEPKFTLHEDSSPLLQSGRGGHVKDWNAMGSCRPSPRGYAAYNGYASDVPTSTRSHTHNHNGNFLSPGAGLTYSLLGISSQPSSPAYRSGPHRSALDLGAPGSRSSLLCDQNQNLGSAVSQQRWSLASAGDVSALRSRLDEMQSQLVRLTQRNGEMGDKYAGVVAELGAAEGRRKEAESVSERLRGEVLRLREDGERLVTENGRLQQRAMETQLKLDAKAEEVGLLAAQLEEVRGGAPSTAFVESIFQQWEDVRGENEALRSTLDSLRTQLGLVKEAARAEMEVQVRAAEQKQQEALMESVSSQLLQQKAEREFYEERVAVLKGQVEKWRADNGRLAAGRQRTEAELASLVRQYAGLEKEYELVMRERGSVLRENEELAVKSSRLEQQNRQLSALTSSEGEVAEITAGAVEREVARLRRSQVEAEESLEESRRQTSEAEEKRDWALSELERAEQERDSLRLMCEEFRRQREEQAAMLMAERLSHNGSDGNGNGEGVNGKVWSPAHSRDSAIYADLREWEVDQLEVPLSPDGLGVELRGGRGDEGAPGPLPIYVHSVAKASNLEGKLRPLDIVLEVNDMDVSGMAHGTVADILNNARGAQLKLRVKRRRYLGMRLQSLSLPPLGSGQDAGLTLENGVYVTAIKASSPAARLGSLAVGDRIVHVNGVPVEGKSAAEVAEMVSRAGAAGETSVGLLKWQPSPMTPSLSFASSSLPTPTTCSAASSDRDHDAPAPNNLHPPNSATAGDLAPRSLLDKVHDKIFGGKKSAGTIKTVAAASIPANNPSSDTLK